MDGSSDTFRLEENVIFAKEKVSLEWRSHKKLRLKEYMLLSLVLLYAVLSNFFVFVIPSFRLINTSTT